MAGAAVVKGEDEGEEEDADSDEKWTVLYAAEEGGVLWQAGMETKEYKGIS